jgi:CheY-like chemotaxis protein
VQTRTVLVVDDDDVIREVAKVALEIVGGWRVRTAVNGPDAQQLARTERPDVVLLDVMMPGMDGLRTAASLSDDPRTRAIPVIFLTAKVPDPDSIKISEPNCVGIIAKPFDPMTLAREIAELVGWRD